MDTNYDVIVVGAGHAGCEAAAAAASLGSKTLLITMDMSKFAQMSCNPAIGGIAKGQIVREIDALGGYTGLVTDASMIQFRMLNKSKGPAMWSPRAQCDRMLFSIEWRNYLERIQNLDFWQDTVLSLVIEDNVVKGVRTQLGREFKAKSVVLTNGTFLNGLMHIGTTQVEGGRISEPSSYGISEQLDKAGFFVGRMKTGTPARLDGRTVDFSKSVEQHGDERVEYFSYMNSAKVDVKQRSCFIFHTNKEVHDHLRTGFEFSPLFTGTIKGVGPRYCPSIEDKVVTFEGRDAHQLFLEPEGWETEEYYLNGFSSSLPMDIQLAALRKIEGFEKVKVFRPGYAIEYDYFPPTQLYHTLETKNLKNLYFAGQINGTTGYEEAGAQGLVAGVNAHLKNNDKEPFILGRDEAYIGVLIDDLVTKGVNEPYRMFTSRAEYRILLRQDNADARLTKRSYELGLCSKERYEAYLEKELNIEKLKTFIKDFSVKPEIVNDKLAELGTSPLGQKMKIEALILRPQVRINDLIPVVRKLKAVVDEIHDRREEVIEEAEILIKYNGYIEREKTVADKLKRLENVRIPDTFDYSKLLSISTEARQKLAKIKPKTIGQAQRIDGVSPADVNVLLVCFGR